jgi:hypothetical protein
MELSSGLASGLLEPADTAAPAWKLRSATGRVKLQVNQREYSPGRRDDSSDLHLVNTTTGAHLWAQTYDRHFQPDQIFAMQDELIPRIVSTYADSLGVLARSISDVVRGKKSGPLSPL